MQQVMHDRLFYRSIPVPRLVEDARIYGVNAEMALALVDITERLHYDLNNAKNAEIAALEDVVDEREQRIAELENELNDLRDEIYDLRNGITT